MQRCLAGLFILGLIMPGQQFANAEETVGWKAQFAGLEGVAISCLRNLERKYTDRICQKLTDHIAGKLQTQGVAHEVLGTSYRRDATPPKSKTFRVPLHLTVLVRATNPNPLGMDIRFNATVPYKAAVEQGGASPRSGHLLIWQNGMTGAGARKRLEKAATKVAKERVDLFLAHIESSWAR